MSDFVLLVVPASLLLIPLIELFGIYQIAIVQEQVSYEIARYAALADVKAEEADLYRLLKDPSSSIKYESTAEVCSVTTATDITQRVTFWPEAIKVIIQGRATCEN